ncbi:MAG TPA: alpha-amylase/4-alpha-glucanotransferase domain-containing protein [Candidatus Eisenbacteria bacterium]|jgi:alpha-amylase
MRSVTLVIVVHNHQPVGNFDGVFAAAYDDAYAPFLALLERRPALRVGLHTSGPLLEWLAAERPAYLGRLRALVARGQVEPWGGAMYEPILPAIPEHDRQGQIATMSDRLERDLGVRPRGLWLAERVWEPGLASSLARAAVEYTAVDDAHFVAAGLERDQLWGHFQTEDQGLALRVLPIHRELRYLIPFGEPAQVIDLLARVAEGGEGRIAVLGDDGEKFGVWPGTRRRCWEEGWLEKFLDALAANPWIQVRTPGEAIAAHPSLGLAYLPSASYHEMQEWALPPAARERYHRAAEVLEEHFGAEAHDLLRGGHWRGFLARYPESNRMHKRMLRVSRALAARPDEAGEAWRAARTRLWRAQCNCPYWHGVFGGLYLPHLRAAVYRELIAAETALADDGARIEWGDLDLDGVGDALLESRAAAAWVSARGARLWGFDDRLRSWNVLDTLARRPEPYHAALRAAAVGAREGESIHGALTARESGLAALVEHYDRDGRDSFLDRWSEPGAARDWSSERFERLASPADSVTLRSPAGAEPSLTKRYRLAEDGALEVEYALEAGGARQGELTVAVNLGLHVPQADDRYVELDGARPSAPHFGARARHDGVTRSTFVDRWAGRRVDLETDRRAALEREPVESVSLSEQGAERVFQGLELRYTFAAALEAGRPWRLHFRLAAGSAA